MKIKETCTTTLVLEQLRACDDFMTVDDVMRATKRERTRVWAALIHLLRSHCVGVEVQGNARYWYALSSADDARSYHRDEYTLHTKRARIRKVKP